MKTVIHHSADYDGIFCREIAKLFLGTKEVNYIGWDFKDPLIPFPEEGTVFILDLPADRPFGFMFAPGEPFKQDEPWDRVIWIDHHASSIASHPTDFPGYRIDGVAASRLAWQWFLHRAIEGRESPALPSKDDYLQRLVTEPLAVRLAGEYDIWDHRGDGDLEFQFGLDCMDPLPWGDLLTSSGMGHDQTVEHLLLLGKAAMACYRKRDADTIRERSFLLEWTGLKFLALNTARCNSLTFAAKDVPETGHDALLAFYTNGSKWTVSMYHAAHRKDVDLSTIAVKHGGGGHKGACGFTCEKLPWQ